MTSVTAFLEDRQIASGDRDSVTRFLEERFPADHSDIRVFEDETGRVTDLDFYDAMQGVTARGRGRPKLGVQAREVTLLPRHWEWLARQPGGASAALRRLVDQARAGGRSHRERQDAAYNFMQAMCGDRSGYEEALRSLYRGDVEAFAAHSSGWPEDVRVYIGSLLGEPYSAAMRRSGAAVSARN